MSFASSGPPGEPLGGVLGRVGLSWRLLGRPWRYLGLSWAVLEAVLDHLGRTWRPSWTILEAILGQRGHLRGHLEPSWRIFWGIGEFPGGRRDGPKPNWKITKTKSKGSSTPGSPVISQQGAADLVAFGHLWPIPPPCLGCRSEAFWTFVWIPWEASRGILGGSLSPL